jgi:hypothetical protein
MNGEIRNYYNILAENLKRRDHLRDLVIDERLWKWISEKRSVSVWIGFHWLRTGAAGCLL